MATCHPDKPLKGHGLCNACYKRTFQNQQRATCHPDRPHEAKGLCQRCYEQDKRKDTEWVARVNSNRKKRYDANPDRFTSVVRDWRRSNPVKALCVAARCRAKRFGVEYSLDYREIEIPERCPLLGIELESGDRRHQDASPTLDRIDPRGGYTPDNVWVISYRANRIKNDATPEEFLRIADALRAKLSQSRAA